jgi:hypothetical protein
MGSVAWGVGPLGRGRGGVRWVERGEDVSGSRETGRAAQTVPWSGSRIRPADFAVSGRDGVTGSIVAAGIVRACGTDDATGGVSGRGKVCAGSAL